MYGLLRSLIVCVLSSLSLSPFATTAAASEQSKSLSDDLVHAEHIVVCSDFDDFSAFRISRFLKGISDASDNILVQNGPTTSLGPNVRNVLIVLVGREPREETLRCVRETYPSRQDMATTYTSVSENLLLTAPAH